MLASVAYGLKRLTVIFAVVATACATLGVVWALLRDRPVAHSVGAFLYVGALLVLAIALGGGSSAHVWGEGSATVLQHQLERNKAISDGFWLIPLGVLLTALGFVVQQYL